MPESKDYFLLHHTGFAKGFRYQLIRQKSPGTEVSKFVGSIWCFCITSQDIENLIPILNNLFSFSVATT